MSGTAERVSLAPIFIQQNSTYYTYESVANDFVGRQTDHDFNMERITRSVTPLNGLRYITYPTKYRSYKNYDCHGNRVVDAHINLGWPNVAQIESSVRARSNPNRPVVSVPTFIAEAKDFINPIRLAGQVALKKKKLSKVLRRKGRIKESADAYLSYKFAIEPTIRDLASLVGAQQAISQRMDELDRLASNGGLRRRVTVFQGTGSSDGDIAIESGLGIVFRNRIQTITTAMSWGTIRWKPVGPAAYKNDKEKAELAARLVLGMNAESLVATAWELFPWSFMIDWFSNVGDLITAANNTVPVEASSVNCMQHRMTSSSWTRADTQQDFSGGSALFTRETKRRDISFGSGLTLSLPLLSGGQLSILGALSASRLSR